MASGIAQQRVRARPYPRGKVRGPAIERLPLKGCSLPNLPLSEVPMATLHPQFPYFKISAQAAVCHALSLLQLTPSTAGAQHRCVSARQGVEILFSRKARQVIQSFIHREE